MYCGSQINAVDSECYLKGKVKPYTVLLYYIVGGWYIHDIILQRFKLLACNDLEVIFK